MGAQSSDKYVVTSQRRKRHVKSDEVCQNTNRQNRLQHLQEKAMVRHLAVACSCCQKWDLQNNDRIQAVELRRAVIVL